MSELATYNFHLIFKGLFRCVPDRANGKLDIYLVDARSPKASTLTGEPLRDHRAAIEFRLDDPQLSPDALYLGICSCVLECVEQLLAGLG